MNPCTLHPHGRSGNQPKITKNDISAPGTRHSRLVSCHSAIITMSLARWEIKSLPKYIHKVHDPCQECLDCHSPSMSTLLQNETTLALSASIPVALTRQHWVRVLLHRRDTTNAAAAPATAPSDTYAANWRFETVTSLIVFACVSCFSVKAKRKKRTQTKPTNSTTAGADANRTHQMDPC